MVKHYEIVPDNSPVVTLEQAKAQLRIESDFEDDDTQIVQMAAAAQAFVREYIGRPLAYDLILFLGAWPASAVEFSCLPEASLTSVEYISNEEGEYTALPAENYAFKADGWVKDLYSMKFTGTLPALPADNDRAVRIVVRASCPEPVRSAILLRLTNLYDVREDRAADDAGSASLAMARPYKTAW